MISKEGLSTKKYSVIESIWIATALMSMEVYEKQQTNNIDDYYFKQAEIRERAQTLTENNVEGARISNWACADGKYSSHNYLREEKGGNRRRLSSPKEFPEKTIPQNLNPSDVLMMNGREILMEELLFFVNEQYAQVVGKHTAKKVTNIDYLHILSYLEKYRGLSYKDPNKPGLSKEESDKYTKIKVNGQNIVTELKKIHEQCSEKFDLKKCEKVSWMDGSNTKTKGYLWVPMKYQKYASRQESISVFVEMKNPKEACFRVSLELRNDNSTAIDEMNYHKHLELPINKEAKLVYVSGSNEFGRPLEIYDTQDVIIEKVKSKKYGKVQICKYIDKAEFTTNDEIQDEILNGVKALIPYYNHVLGINSKEEYWPSIEEYNPGISREQWEEFLKKDSVEYKETLIMLKTILDVGGEASCKEVGEILNVPAAACISRGSNLAKRVKKYFGLNDYVDQKGKVWHFVTCFVGRYIKDDLYSWKLRDELKEALENMDLSNIINSCDKTVGFDKNMILYGPPGTGKTYHSAIYAVAICDGKNLEDLKDYTAVMKRYEILKSEGRVAFTTFHQSYGYEEFIEGIRPVMKQESSDVGYSIEPGVFKAFCKKAKEEIELSKENGTKPKKFVMVIDEINRGNISKIFGELITLIEGTKRAGMPEAASAILPYSGEAFSVPSNVYILGTMNTADRSIQLMDTALRRRFSFIEMMPEVSVLKELGLDKVKFGDTTLNVSAMLEVINERISFLFDREHTIGHAFFTGLKDTPTIEKLASIFEKSVIPLLQEYFYEDYQKIQLVLGDNAKKDSETKFIVDKKIELKNLFMGNVEDIVDEKEVKYEINHEAFLKIESYKGIANGL